MVSRIHKALKLNKVVGGKDFCRIGFNYLFVYYGH